MQEANDTGNRGESDSMMAVQDAEDVRNDDIDTQEDRRLDNSLVAKCDRLCFDTRGLSFEHKHRRCRNKTCDRVFLQSCRAV